jgi:acylphosphatase
MNRRLTVRIEGRVQGVGFRAFTARHGQRLRLAGTVRNLPDGAVELVAEGSEERLSELLTQVRGGPSGAVVTGVEVAWDDATGELKPFGIGY